MTTGTETIEEMERGVMVSLQFGGYEACWTNRMVYLIAPGGLINVGG